MIERLPFDAYYTNFQTLFGNLTLRTLVGPSLSLPLLFTSLIPINYFYRSCVNVTYLMKVLNFIKIKELLIMGITEKVKGLIKCHLNFSYHLS